MFDLERLRTFYYLIKEDTILKASAVLNRDRSTINRQVIDLEEYYGEKLFYKIKKRFELTEKGKELFKLAQEHIPSLEMGCAKLKIIDSYLKNLTIITTTGTIGIWLIRKLEKLMAEFPDLHVSIITTNADIDFENSKADVGVLPRLFAEGLSQKKVLTVHSKLYASPEYLNKYGAPKTLEDLKNHKLISFYSDNEGNIGNVDWHLKKGFPESAIRESYIRVNSAFLLFEAACRGLGIIAIGEEFEYLQNSNLVRVLPDEPGLNFDVFYVTRSNAIKSRVEKRFLEILLD